MEAEKKDIRKGKIRIILVVCLVLLCIFAKYGSFLTLLTRGYTQGVLTHRIYNVENVFDEIWNLVISESHGTRTILTKSTEGAFADYDLWQFSGLHIPEIGIGIAIHEFNEFKECDFYVHEDGQERPTNEFVYSYPNKTLSYDGDLDSFKNGFLKAYFEWAGKSSKFALDRLGQFETVFCDPIWKYRSLVRGEEVPGD